MGLNSKITEDSLDKLPKWAQGEIIALRRDVSRLREEI